MAKPKVKKTDYKYCEKCDVLVPVSKLAAPDDLFEGSSGEKVCPFCDSPVKDLE